MSTEERYAFIELEKELESLATPGMRPGLSRLSRLLLRLGNPQRAFPAVHVAGTNGKGSVCASLDSICRHAGMRCGLFTSPHLCSLAERILINGEPLYSGQWRWAKRRVAECIEQDAQLRTAPPTFFELATAIAFCLFQQEKVDLVICETGMGGRLDATNLLSRVLVSVVTSIGDDHQRFLGSDMRERAWEKFSIFRPAGTALFSGTPPQLNEQFDTACKRIDARGCIPSTCWDVTVIHEDLCGSQLSLHRKGDGMIHPHLPLPGRHQIENSLLAAEAASSLSRTFPAITPTAIESGLSGARWHGRGELVHGNPDLLLDGAHNLQGYAALVALLNNLWNRNKETIVLFASMEDKGYTQGLELLRPCAQEVICTDLPEHARSVPSDRLARTAEDAGWPHVRVAGNVENALDLIRGRGQLGVVCGSLYLVGKVLEVLWNNEKGRQPA
ncbi:MAG: bifunctional folylpolyglutamate synthase/dihydrofolate synthase [Synergistales bacterium]|nr:bifunctional folylpolyglutamate synthase/dihydrofolate synthase [Synergistales bacterium]